MRGRAQRGACTLRFLHLFSAFYSCVGVAATCSTTCKHACERMQMKAVVMRNGSDSFIFSGRSRKRLVERAAGVRINQGRSTSAQKFFLLHKKIRVATATSVMSRHSAHLFALHTCCSCTRPNPWQLHRLARPLALHGAVSCHQHGCFKYISYRTSIGCKRVLTSRCQQQSHACASLTLQGIGECAGRRCSERMKTVVIKKRASRSNAMYRMHYALPRRF